MGFDEGRQSYNAKVFFDLQEELVATLDRERLGKAPAWTRSLVVDLLKRIMNLRAEVARLGRMVP